LLDAICEENQRNTDMICNGGCKKSTTRNCNKIEFTWPDRQNSPLPENKDWEGEQALLHSWSGMSNENGISKESLERNIE
jgi:hypothetical protein